MCNWTFSLERSPWEADSHSAIQTKRSFFHHDMTRPQGRMEQTTLDMESNYDCIEQAVTDSRQMVIL